MPHEPDMRAKDAAYEALGGEPTAWKPWKRTATVRRLADEVVVDLGNERAARARDYFASLLGRHEARFLVYDHPYVPWVSRERLDEYLIETRKFYGAGPFVEAMEEKLRQGR